MFRSATTQQQANSQTKISEKQVIKRSAMFRSSHNSHRYFYFVNGKLRTFQTHEDDFLSNVAALFGNLNACFSTFASSFKPLATAAALSALLLASPHAQALPSGYQSVAGNVQFDQNGNVLNVTSQANRSIANYRSFNVGSNETVNFWLASSRAAILNRVTGGDPSTILGRINANGKVFLVNPSGIFFGQSAQVNVGSLFASTLNITDENFLSDNFVFSKDPGAPGAIINEGTILVSPKGTATLLAGSIDNKGSIIAPGGSVNLAVGDQISVAVADDILVDVTVDQALQEKVANATHGIQNSGLIQADGGRVKLEGKFAGDLYRRAINNDGIIEAHPAIDGEGNVVFNAVGENGLALVENKGTIDVSGTTNSPNAGTISITGDRVAQSGHVLAQGNESGQGGHISIRSTDRTVLNAGSITSAKGAADNSSAGEIVIWSDKDTYFNNGATLDVSGGALTGNGGFLEVSGYETVYFRGQAFGGANDGEAGTVLIDPTDIIIANAGADTVDGGDNNGGIDEDYAEGNPTETYNPQAGGAFNGFRNIWLQANNDITINDAFNTSTATGRTSVSLRLEAKNNINVNAAVITNNADITLSANSDNTGGGGVSIANTGSLASGNGNITLSGSSIEVNGSITANTGASGGNVSITTLSGSNGSVNLGANVSGRTVTLSADGAGNIAQTAGSISGRNLSLSSGSGNIGNNSQALQTAINQTLTANTTGSVYIAETDDVTIGASSAGSNQTFQVSSGEDLTVGGVITTGTGTQVNLTANDDLSVDRNINADAAVTLTADSDGDNDGTLSVSNNRSVNSNSHNIEVKAARINLNGSGAINAGTANVAITASNNKEIQIAGGSDSNSVLSLSNNELDNITASNVTIGSASTAANITFAGNLDLDDVDYNLLVQSGQDILSSSNALNKGSYRLNLTAANAVSLSASGLAQSIQINDITADSVTLSQAVLLGQISVEDVLATHNVSITSNSAISGINIGSVSGENVTLENTSALGGITTTGDITASNNLYVSTSNVGNINIGGSVNSTGTAGSSVVIKTNNTNRAINVTGTLNITNDADKTLQISTGGGNVFANSYFTNDLTFKSIELSSASGNINLGGLINTTDSLNISAQNASFAKDVTAGDDISVSGPVTLNGNVTFTADSDADTTGLMSFNNSITTNDYNLGLHGSGITVSGDINAGLGDVDINNSSANQDVNVANVTGNDVRFWTKGTDSDITVNGNVTASGDLRLRTQYGNIAVTGDVNSNGLTGTYTEIVASELNGSSTFNLDGNLNIAQDAGKNLLIWVQNGTILGKSFFANDMTFNDINFKIGAASFALGGTLTGNNIALYTNDVTIGGDINAKGNLTFHQSAGTLTTTKSVTFTADSDGNNDGNLYLASGSVNTQNNNLGLAGAQLRLDMGVNAGTGTVSIAPSSSKAISVYGSVDNNDSTSLFDVSAAELARITAANVIIGSEKLAGGLSIDGNIDLSGSGAGKFNLTLNNEGNITATNKTFNLGAIGTPDHSLNLSSAAGDINLTFADADLTNAVTNLTAGNTVTVSVGQNSGFRVYNDVSGDEGVSITSSGLSPITIDNNVTANSGNVLIQTQGAPSTGSGGKITVGGNVTGEDVTLETLGNAGGSPNTITVDGDVNSSGNLKISTQNSHVNIGGDINSTGGAGTSVYLSSVNYQFNLDGALNITQDAGKDVWFRNDGGTLYDNSFFDGDLLFNNISLSSLGNVPLRGNYTATNKIYIYSVLTGNVTQTAGKLLTANQVYLQSSSGATFGSATNAININANTLVLHDAGTAFINETDNVDIYRGGNGITGDLTVTAGGNIGLKSSQTQVDNLTFTTTNGGNVTFDAQVIASGDVTTDADGSITTNATVGANNVDFTAADDVTLNANLSATNTATLEATSGDLTTAHNVSITANTANLTAGGSIQSSSPVYTSVNNLSVNAGGNADIANNKTVNLNRSNIAGTFTLATTTGDIILQDDVNADIPTAGDVYLTAQRHLLNPVTTAEVHADDLVLTAQTGGIGSTLNGSGVPTGTFRTSANALTISAINNRARIRQLKSVLVHASSAKQVLAIDTTGTITTDGILSATNAITLTTRSNGSVSLGANVQAGTDATITANGTGNIITNNGAIISAGDLADLRSGRGNINVDTTTARLRARTTNTGTVLIDETNAVTVLASTGGTSWTLNAGGNITTTGTLAATNLTLNSTNGYLNIGGNLNANASTGTANLTATGNIYTAHNVVITANTANFNAGGNIYSNSPVLTAVNTLSVTATGNADISNSKTVTLNTSNVGGLFTLATTAGDINVAGNVNQALLPNPGDVTFTAFNNLYGAGTIYAGDLHLTATNGSIYGATNASPLTINADDLWVTATNGDASIFEIDSVNLQDVNVGGVFNFGTGSGDIVINGTLTAGDISLTAGNNIYGTGFVLTDDLSLTATNGSIYGANSGDGLDISANTLTANAGNAVALDQRSGYGNDALVVDDSSQATNGFTLTSQDDLDVTGTITGTTVNLSVTGGNNLITSGSGVLSGTNLILTTDTTGDIDVTTIADTLDITAGDDATINESNGVTLLGSSAGDEFSLNTNNNGTISLDGGVTALSIDLDADGSGNITQVSGTLSGNSVNLTSDTGSIGASGTRIQTNAETLFANTSGTGSVYINENDSVEIGASSAGALFDIQNNNNGNISTTGVIGAADINLDSDNNLALGANLNANTSTGTVNLTADADISTTHGVVISGNTANFNAGGSVYSNSPVLTSVNNLAVNVSGSADIENNKTVNINRSNVAGTFSLATSAGDIALQDDVNEDLGTAGDVNFTAAGSISDPSNNVVYADDLSLTAQNGNIDGDSNNQFRTRANTLTISALNGQARIRQLKNVRIHTSGANQDLNFDVTGNIITDGVLSASDVTLSTRANGKIDIGANIQASDDATLTANGSGTITTLNGAVIGASDLTDLKSTSGKIDVDTNTASLKASTTGDVVVDEANDVTVLASNAGSIRTFTLNANGNITTTGTISARSINLDSDTGYISLGANLNGNALLGTVNLTANTDISTVHNVLITASTANFNAGGNIYSNSPVLTSVNFLSVNAGGSATIQNNKAVGLNASNVAGTLTLATTAGDISVLGDINSSITPGDVILTAKGNILSPLNNVVNADDLTLTAQTGNVAQLNLLGLVLGQFQTNANTLTITANNGFASVRQFKNVLVHTSSVNSGKELSLDVTGNITTDGVLSGSDVTLNTRSNGFVSLGANIQAGDDVTITTNGSGNITTTNGAVIVAGDLTDLNSTSGNIDVDTTTARLRARTGGTVLVDETNAVSVLASNGGSSWTLNAGGTISTLGTITASSISLDATSGAISLGANLNGNLSSGTINLTATGDIYTAHNVVITANTVNFDSDAAIYSNSPVLLHANNLSVQAVGSADIQNDRTINVNASNVGGLFTLATTAGDIHVVGNVNEGLVPNPGDVTFTAFNTIYGPGTIYAGNLRLTATNGSIYGATSSEALTINANDLWVTALNGDANLFEMDSVNLNTINVGGLFKFANGSGDIVINGTLTAGDISLTAANNLRGPGFILTDDLDITATTGSIYGTDSNDGLNISANTLTANAGDSVALDQLSGYGNDTLVIDDSSEATNRFTLTSQDDVDVTGTITGSTVNLSVTGGNNLISSGAGLITGGDVVLTTDTTGNIDVHTAADTLDITAGNDATITEADDVTILSSSAGNAFSLSTNNDGDINLDGGITALSIDLNANGSGDISQLSGTLSATSVDLTSGTGNIGAANARIETNAATLTANTAGAGSVLINEADGVEIGTSTAGALFDVQNNNDGDITTTGIITATDINLDSDNNLSIGANLNANTSTGTLNLTADLDISTTHGVVISGNTANFNAGGSIYSNSPVLTSVNNLSVNAGGNADIENNKTVRLTESNVQGQFNLATTAGDINLDGDVNSNLTTPGNIWFSAKNDINTTSGTLYGDNISLNTVEGSIGNTGTVQIDSNTLSLDVEENAAINEANDLTLLDSEVGGLFELTNNEESEGDFLIDGDISAQTIDLTADGDIDTGIDKSGDPAGTLYASNVDLTSRQGNIGTDGTIQTATDSVAAHASNGNVFINEADSVSLLASEALGEFNLSNNAESNGSIIISGDVHAQTINLTADNNIYTPMVFLSLVGPAGPDPTPTLYAETVNLNATNGDIGALGTVQTATDFLSAHADNGSVTVNDADSVALLASSAQTEFNLSNNVDSNGNISIEGDVHAETINLTADGSINTPLKEISSEVVYEDEFTTIIETTYGPAGTLYATNVNLNATQGDIGSRLTVQTATDFLTAHANNGKVLVNDADSVTLLASSAKTRFQVTNNTDSNGDILIGEDISAETIYFTADGSINTLYESGGTLSRSAGTSTPTLYAETVNLNATNGSIGNEGIVQTATDFLWARAINGSIHVNDADTVTLLESSAGTTFTLTNNEASNGDILISGNVSAETINLMADGSINTLYSGEGAPSGFEGTFVPTLSAQTVNLNATNGSIGNEGVVQTATDYLSAHANNGSVFVNDADTVTLQESSADRSFYLSNNEGSNGDILIGGDVSAEIISLTADGDINTLYESAGTLGRSVGTSTPTLYAETVMLNATNGSIGNEGIVQTATDYLSAHADNGSVTINDADTVTLLRSSADTSFDLTNNEGSNGDILIGGDVSAETITLTADGNINTIYESSGTLSKLIRTGIPTLFAETVNLNATNGSIGNEGIVQTATDFLTAHADNGSVTVNDADSVTIHASNAGGLFQVTNNVDSEGDINTDGEITATDINLTADGDIALGADLNANTSSGTVNLTANGDITTSFGVVISGNTANFVAGGSIHSEFPVLRSASISLAIPANPVLIHVNNLSVEAGGDATLENDQTVRVLDSNVQGLFSLATTSGDINLDGNINGKLETPGDVRFSAYNNINTLSGTLFGDLISLTALNGSIGNTGIVEIDGISLAVNANEDAFINEADDLTLLDSDIGDLFELTNNEESDGDFLIDGDIYANTINITADGSIDTHYIEEEVTTESLREALNVTAAGTLYATNVNLNASNGSIGAVGTVQTATDYLSAHADNGSVFINDADTVTLLGSSADTTFTLTNNTESNGDILIGGNVYANTINLTADGNINALYESSGTLTRSARTFTPTLYAETVNLNATNGSIGAEGIIQTATDYLSAHADSGSVYVNEADSVTLHTSSAGSLFEITNNVESEGDINTDGEITASDINLTADAGIFVGANLNGNTEEGTINLTANNDIETAHNVVLAAYNVVFNAGGSVISNSPVLISATNVSAHAGGNATIQDIDGDINVLGSDVGGNLIVNAQSGNLNVNGIVNSGNLFLNTLDNGNITFNSDIFTDSLTELRTDGLGDITSATGVVNSGNLFLSTEGGDASLVTNIQNINGQTGSGNITVIELNGLTIGGFENSLGEDNAISGNQILFDVLNGDIRLTNLVRGNNIGINAQGGNIVDGNGNARNIDAQGNSFMFAEGLLGSLRDPIEILVRGGTFRVRSNSASNGISGVFTGRVSPRNKLNIVGFPPGAILFNGEDVFNVRRELDTQGIGTYHTAVASNLLAPNQGVTGTGDVTTTEAQILNIEDYIPQAFNLLLLETGESEDELKKRRQQKQQSGSSQAEVDTSANRQDPLSLLFFLDEPAEETTP